MNTRVVRIGSLLALIALLASYQLAFAHETVTVGDYEIEIGWVDEPAIVGQQNAIVVNVSNEAGPVDEVSELIVSVSYGAETKTLTLQPLGEDTPGQFVAPILPTRAGQYTIQLRGKLGDADVNADVQPEEVESADVLQFPAGGGTGAGLGTTGWLALLGLLAGIGGLTLGLVALRKSR
jgi:hypothetical protein